MNNHQSFITLIFTKCLGHFIVKIGESCDPKIRGILGSLPTIFMSLAILIAYIIGSVAKWDTLAWCSSSMACMYDTLLLLLSLFNQLICIFI